MTTDTGVMAAGTIVEMIGAEISGVGISGAENRPAGKPSAIAIGSATTIGPSGTVIRTITVTIVASASPRAVRCNGGDIAQTYPLPSQHMLGNIVVLDTGILEKTALLSDQAPDIGAGAIPAIPADRSLAAGTF